MNAHVTMQDLISAVSEFARSEAELVATVVWMVNSGSVRLGGDAAGGRFDLRSVPQSRTHALAL
jgi:hypothetical protein